MLVPARLVLAAPLASEWTAILARDGFASAGDGRKVRLTGGQHTEVVHIDPTPDGSVLDLSLVTDERQRGRFEAILLASGARFEDWSDITTPLRSIYRIDADAWPSIADRIRREGLDVHEQPAAWCPGGEAFPAGEIRAAGVSLAFTTGPARAPRGGSPAAFVDLRPRAVAAISERHRDLIRQCDALLVESGAAPIYRLGSPAPTESA